MGNSTSYNKLKNRNEIVPVPEQVSNHEIVAVPAQKPSPKIYPIKAVPAQKPSPKIYPIKAVPAQKPTVAKFAPVKPPKSSIQICGKYARITTSSKNMMKLLALFGGSRSIYKGEMVWDFPKQHFNILELYVNLSEKTLNKSIKKVSDAPDPKIFLKIGPFQTLYTFKKNEEKRIAENNRRIEDKKLRDAYENSPEYLKDEIKKLKSQLDQTNRNMSHNSYTNNCNHSQNNSSIFSDPMVVGMGTLLAINSMYD